MEYFGPLYVVYGLPRTSERAIQGINSGGRGDDTGSGPGYGKTSKNPGANFEIKRGGAQKKIVFGRGVCRAYAYIAQMLHTSNKIFVSLCMNYVIEIQNRIQVGFALGFSYYGIDDEYDYGEIILFLGLISVHIKYGGN
jgi:hypothetical protein